MAFTLPDLPYPYDALAPYMSRETLELPSRQASPSLCQQPATTSPKARSGKSKPLEEVVKGTFGKNPGLFNNAGQHYNHIHFWKWMKNDGGGDKLPGKLEKQIIADIGSIAKMKEDFIQAGVTQFGSGWCWLAVKDGKIIVMKTPNGENPLVHGAKPILGCDVWEHSYYIDYRNRRPDYLKASSITWSIGTMWPRLYEAAIEISGLALYARGPGPSAAFAGGRAVSSQRRKFFLPVHRIAATKEYAQGWPQADPGKTAAAAQQILLHGELLAGGAIGRTRRGCIVLCVLAAVAVIAAFTFRDYGLGWDDYTHAEYGGLLLNLYASGFADQRALSFVNLYMLWRRLRHARRRSPPRSCRSTCSRRAGSSAPRSG